MTVQNAGPIILGRRPVVARDPSRQLHRDPAQSTSSFPKTLFPQDRPPHH
jgi:hypothetical protein